MIFGCDACWVCRPQPAPALRWGPWIDRPAVLRSPVSVSVSPTSPSETAAPASPASSTCRAATAANGQNDTMSLTVLPEDFTHDGHTEAFTDRIFGFCLTVSVFSTDVTVIRLALPTVSVTSPPGSASVSPALPANSVNAARSTSSASARLAANVRATTM